MLLVELQTSQRQQMNHRHHINHSVHTVRLFQEANLSCLKIFVLSNKEISGCYIALKEIIKNSAVHEMVTLLLTEIHTWTEIHTHATRYSSDHQSCHQILTAFNVVPALQNQCTYGKCRAPFTESQAHYDSTLRNSKPDKYFFQNGRE